MTAPLPLALPLFDTIDFIKQQTLCAYYTQSFAAADFAQAKAYLLSYNGNDATFNAYRRETERLLHWSWQIAQKSVRDLRRADIENYLAFCQDPPLSWIGTRKVPRFIEIDGVRTTNPLWRPFVATVSKAAHRRGKSVDPKKYALSPKALREIFTVCSSFYSFMIMEEYTEVNPIQHVRQKSRFFMKKQGKQKIRRLSSLQWGYVIETAEQLADADPNRHEKTLFMMTALYAMYLRISELAATRRWTPRMCDFYRDQDGLWWFNVVGKGNKQRQIAVSDKMLAGLKRYRQSLNLAPLPSPAEQEDLLPKTRGKGPITSTSYLRKIVQGCFDLAIERLKADNMTEDADSLLEATVHWLRHTGISEDVRHRPREHVRDDAGHSSSAITDKYIDIELRERHATARKKRILEDT